MGLKEYRSKRNFGKTSEPEPGSGPKGDHLIFVIHKHAARALHYDLRLEMDGVLKSWAVPKGPSLDPYLKRLAIMVEDHPLDYRDFEGIISEGNYGAGSVIIWDRGFYQHPSAKDRKESETLLLEGLRKGDLKFVLAGEKLRGEFALVKTGMGAKSWLLLKKKDSSANKEDILRENRSVVSNKTLEEIFESDLTTSVRQSSPDDKSTQRKIKISPPSSFPESKGRSGGIFKAKKINQIRLGEALESEDLKNAPVKPMPHNIKPMLTTLVKKAFDHPDWIFEVKWDGYRAMAEVRDKGISLYSRNLIPLDRKFPPIAESLQRFGFDAVLDGEIVVVDDEGHPDFQMLQNYQKSGKGHLLYHVFDLLYFQGHDLTSLPLLTRKQILEKILPSDPRIKFSAHVPSEGILFFTAAKEKGLEGIIAKHSQSTYRTGRRSRQWLKVKTKLTQEGVIAGFTQPVGSRKYFGSLVLGVYEGDQLIYIGHSGGGFKANALKEIRGKLDPLIIKECPFKVKPETNTPVTWVKPELVCEVVFHGWTDEGLMRQPVFHSLRKDKDPREVVREKPGKAQALHQS